MTSKRQSSRQQPAVNYSEASSRRTSQQVADEKKAKQLARLKAQAEKDAAIEEVAADESTSRQRNRERLAHPGQVYSQGPGIARASRTRPVDTESQGKAERDGKKYKVMTVEITDDEDDDIGHTGEGPNPFRVVGGAQRKKDANHDFIMKELADDSGSGSDYQLPLGGDEDEDEDDEDVELEGDEPDTELAKKRGGGKKKKEKRGVRHRDRIRKARDDESDEDETPSRPSKKSRSSAGRDGLLAGWQKNRDVLLPKPPASAPRNAEDDGPTQGFGGFTGEEEDDDLERQMMQLDDNGIETNTKILPHDDSSKVTKKPGKKGGSDSPEDQDSKARVQVRQLPKAVLAVWKDIKSRVFNHLAGEKPWDDIPDEDLAAIINKATGRSPAVSIKADDSDSYALWVHIRTLIRNQVIPTEWRYKVRDAARVAVKEEWELRKLDTKTKIEEHVKSMLAPDYTDRASKSRPFIFGSTDALDWDGSEHTDVFKGRMVLKTFAAHLDIISSIPEDEQEKRPSGALCMAIQAVNRILEYSLSGKMVLPSKFDRAGQFSKENWNDWHKGKPGSKKTKLVRRATRFLATMDDLSDDEWAEILDAARGYMTASKKNSDGRRVVYANPEDVEVSDDEVIIDPKRVRAFRQASGTPKTPMSREVTADPSGSGEST
ncbi:hypothetical protein NMY22_g15325 [Coprinellus aureogranulatus]|nr:hypothetical protein NMY22_g15325 [Coprinellus aureogranulatus]